MSSQQQQQQHHEQQDTTAEDEATTTTTPPPELPRPTKSEVHSCQFSTWYPTFRNMSKKSSITSNTTTYKFRKNVTIESQIIRPLPHEFIEYLLSDGVRLPQCARNVSSCMKDDTTTGTGDDDDDGWENNNNDKDDDDNSNEEEEIKQYNFPQLTEQIQTTLQTLGGGNGVERCNLGCMPKLNWSSPKDATWMNCGTLKCTTVGDVYLLLKSSEFVCFDLEKAWYDLEPETETASSETAASSAVAQDDQVVQDEQVAANTTGNDDDNDDEGKPPIDFEYELVLRKWCNLHPSMEFRCFVYDHELIAISQRHSSKFYSHLQLSEEEDEIHPTNDIIHSFYETYVQHRFASGEIHKYVMDVYVDSQERTWIVDFNVWGKRTDSLLFEWGELMEIGEGVRKLKKKKNGSSSSNEDDDDENGEEEVAAMLPMPEWRVVTKDMKDLTYDPLSSFRGPTDVMNFMGGGGGGGNNNNDDGGGGFEASSFKQFMDQCVRPSEM